MDLIELVDFEKDYILKEIETLNKKKEKFKLLHKDWDQRFITKIEKCGEISKLNPPKNKNYCNAYKIYKCDLFFCPFCFDRIRFSVKYRLEQDLARAVDKGNNLLYVRLCSKPVSYDKLREVYYDVLLVAYRNIKNQRALDFINGDFRSIEVKCDPEKRMYEIIYNCIWVQRKNTSIISKEDLKQRWVKQLNRYGLELDDTEVSIKNWELTEDNLDELVKTPVDEDLYLSNLVLFDDLRGGISMRGSYYASRKLKNTYMYPENKEILLIRKSDKEAIEFFGSICKE